MRDVVTEKMKINDFASFMEAYNCFGGYQSTDGNAVVFLLEDYDDLQPEWPDFVVSYMSQNKTNLTIEFDSFENI